MIIIEELVSNIKIILFFSSLIKNKTVDMYTGIKCDLVISNYI